MIKQDKLFHCALWKHVFDNYFRRQELLNSLLLLYKATYMQRYCQGSISKASRDFNRFCKRWKLIRWKRCLTYFELD